MSWKNQIIQDLKERDSIFEQPSSALFVSFTLLQSKFKETEQQLQVLQNNEKIRAISDIIGERDSLKEKNQELSDSETKYRQQITELQSKIRGLQDVKTSNESQIEKLKKYIAKRDEEQRVKNNIITEINDDLLALQTENNILADSVSGLNDKIEALTNENTQLINRWVEKVALDADKLNEVNQLILKFKEMK